MYRGSVAYTHEHLSDQPYTYLSQPYYRDPKEPTGNPTDNLEIMHSAHYTSKVYNVQCDGAMES